MTNPPLHETCLIVDFGSQVTQLIARRLRESGIYCEIHPFQSVDDALIDQLLDLEAPGYQSNRSTNRLREIGRPAIPRRRSSC